MKSPYLGLGLGLVVVACGDDGRMDGTTVVTSVSTSAPGTSSSGDGTASTTPTGDATGTTELPTGTSTGTTEAASSSGSSTCAGPDCAMCQDGETRCTGEVSEVCDAGLWIEFEQCDAVQGLVCGAKGVCEGSCAASKLGQSYIGCDFYPTVTTQHDDYNQAPHGFAVTIANTTADPAAVTITRGDADVAMVMVGPGSVEAVELPWVMELSEGPGPSVMVAGGAYRLRSDQPVTVYQYNPFAATVSNDASLLIPVNGWGKRVVVASSTEAFDYPSFYAVVAAHDQTTVTLTPSATGKKVQAGAGVAADGTGVVVLGADDVLQVATSEGGDLTGTRISADRPVQVIAGHKCSKVPQVVDSCDHLEEAMFPVEALAKEYIVVPPVQSPKDTLEQGQVVRVIASEANTKVTFTPDQGADIVLVNAGDFVELNKTIARFKVSADKKILVAQYMVGQGGGYGAQDPSMLLAVATEQYRKDYLFQAPNSWTANYVDVILKSGTKVTVDGVDVMGFIKIAGTEYSVAHVKLNQEGSGVHTLSAADRVGISVYGIQDFGSYWVVGGLDLDHL